MHDLLAPETSPFEHPEKVEVRETHISLVFLTDEHAFKLKKNVCFGFLDFSTLEKRHAACQAELGLNQALAPDVYLGVLPLYRATDGRLSFTPRPGSALIDWLVQMRRLPDESRADQILGRSELYPALVEKLARRIAQFHSSASVSESISRFGEAPTLFANLNENFEQTRESLPQAIGARDAAELEAWQRDFLTCAAGRFTRRVSGGKIRDGHGDLRLEQIYFINDEILLLDRIEFNERFRYGDVCADLAFLSMDLRFHGNPELAEYLLSVYARETGDYDLYGLIGYYESYRAFVRGKVAAFRAGENALLEAKHYFKLALMLSRQQLITSGPHQVIAIGGIIASGKSTLAEDLSEATGIPVVNTDRVRKESQGVPASRSLREEAWTGAYSPTVTRRVYQEVFREAAVILDSGRSVIIDASFRTQLNRLEARRLARQRGLPFRFIECSVSTDECRRRLVERNKGLHDSDARADLLETFLKNYEPVTELPQHEYIKVSTGYSRQDSLLRSLQEINYQAIRKVSFRTG